MELLSSVSSKIITRFDNEGKDVHAVSLMANECHDDGDE